MTKPMTDEQRAAKEARRQENRERWRTISVNANGIGKLRGPAMPEVEVEAPPPKSGLADLIHIMRDETVPMRQRITAGIAASRVERLAMAGELEPEGVRFLRWITASEFNPLFRREAAQALAYYERRVAKMAVTFDVADEAELRTKWMRILNGCIRAHLAKHQRWPQDKHLLIGPNETFKKPSGDPDTALSALLLAGNNRHARRRQRKIDEPVSSGMWSGSEQERLELIRPIAELIHERIYGG